MRTPAYVQVVGFIDQTKINIQGDDTGGELDPHGADLRGNPLGGLVYSTAWSSDKKSFEQVIEWHNFMGGSQFCFKVCDPAGANAANFCQHIYDRIGCAYNPPTPPLITASLHVTERTKTIQAFIPTQAVQPRHTSNLPKH